MLRNLLFVFFCCLSFFALHAQPVTEGLLLIKAGKLYDAEKGVFLTNQEVLIDNGRIKAVGPKLTVPKGTRVLDYPKATMTPGLIDAHTHLLMVQKLEDNLATDVLLNSTETRVLRAAGFAKAYLASGFTTIRDLGNAGQYLDVEVAKAIRRGYIEGPRMLVSGPIISAMDGQFYQLPLQEQERITRLEYRVVNGPADAALAVKEHANNMVDVIKVVVFGERMGLSGEELKAIVTTAHAHRLTVTAHAVSERDVVLALEAGVDGIEHGYSLADSSLERMAKRGVYLVPTDPSIQGVIDIEKIQHKPNSDTAAIRGMLAPLTDRLQRAVKKGVLVVAGSDAYFELKKSRGDQAKDMLAAYFDEGLSPADVLRTATWNAAQALGRGGQLGVIKPGVIADIVVFNGDLEKAFKQVLFEVQTVIKDGKIVP
ncbi:amidohydrolase family protein [Paraflavitalea pollutisoli]|uniref:amidohydrolase family protein n=1 Tax=Paraflavitalea pollutisoli TaxID=3034143 RepID=UPI0023EDFC1A|nr:amidohydrolase family protein [Paraflavitalea sp. H1-2-19X]